VTHPGTSVSGAAQRRETSPSAPRFVGSGLIVAFSAIVAVDVGCSDPAQATGAAFNGDDAAGLTDASSPLVDAAATARERQAICDGTGDARLFYVATGSLSGPVGSRFLEAPGYPFAVVDGQCTMWLREDAWTPLLSMLATAQQVSALAAVMRLHQWRDRRAELCSLAYDVPRRVLGAPNSSLTIYPGGVMGCDELPSGLIPDIHAQIAALASTAQPVNADVLYTLVPFTGRDFGTTFKGAAPWPLADVIELTVEEEPQIASGAEAAQLRALRDAYLRGDLGSRADVFIPIQQNDGSRYELRVRDKTPFESADGSFSAKRTY
jgi:hypothetical protein